MSDLSPARKIVQSEEVVFGAAASEATASKIGGSVNFLLMNSCVHAIWNMNGTYGAGSVGSQIGVDGCLIAPIDMEIVAFQMSNFVTGSSGDSEIDIYKSGVQNSQGSTIFTVRPKINFSAGNFVWMSKWFADTPVTHFNPSGTTLPTFISRNVDAGEMLSLNWVTRQALGQSGQVHLWLRPR